MGLLLFFFLIKSVPTLFPYNYFRGFFPHIKVYYYKNIEMSTCLGFYKSSQI